MLCSRWLSHCLYTLCVFFKWSPFQFSSHRSHYRTNRPVVWSHPPWRYTWKHFSFRHNGKIKNTEMQEWTFCDFFLLVCAESAFPFPIFPSLQCSWAVVPSQLSRTFILLPTWLLEWGSKIRGEIVAIVVCVCVAALLKATFRLLPNVIPNLYCFVMSDFFLMYLFIWYKQMWHLMWTKPICDVKLMPLKHIEWLARFGFEPNNGGIPQM